MTLAPFTTEVLRRVPQWQSFGVHSAPFFGPRRGRRFSMQKGAAFEMSDPQSSVPLEVTCAQVKARLDAGDKFVFLDCREPNEHQTVSISPAKLLPMSEIQNRIAELDAQRSADVIVHCHHGGRSLRVVNWLRQQGFASAQSMAGGIDQWAIEIDPSLPRY